MVKIEDINSQVSLLSSLLLPGGNGRLDDADSMESLAVMGLGDLATGLKNALERCDKDAVEALASAFLASVAYRLAQIIESAKPEVTVDEDVITAMTDYLVVKEAELEQQKDELCELLQICDGYAYEDKALHISEAGRLEDEINKVGRLRSLFSQPDTVRSESGFLTASYTFWQAAGYTADYLYREGLSDRLMASSWLSDVIGASLQHIDLVPLQCRSLVARTVRLCTAVAQDGSEQLEQQLGRIDRAILDNFIHIADSEFLFVCRSSAYLQAYMRLRSHQITLDQVDVPLLDKQLCMVALRADPDQIKWVPAALVDNEMAVYAVYNGSPMNLRFVPGGVQSAGLVHMACIREPLAVQFAYPPLVDKQLAVALVIRNGLALQWLRQHISAVLVHLAVANTADALSFVPGEFMDDVTVSTALYKDYRVYGRLPYHLRTAGLSLRVLAVNPRAACDLPLTLLDDVSFMHKAALIRNGWQQYVNKNAVQP